jgi:hypothetical protein
MTEPLNYFCDDQRHLVCMPYSLANLHRMAEALDLKRCWFHKDHYDIPKTRVDEIMAKCTVLPTRKIAAIVGRSLRRRYTRRVADEVKKKVCDMIWQQAGVTATELQAACKCCARVIRQVTEELVSEGEVIETISDDRRTKAFMQGY